MIGSVITIINYGFCIVVRIHYCSIIFTWWIIDICITVIWINDYIEILSTFIIIIGITTKSLSVLLFGCQSIEVYVDGFIYVLTILVVLILKSLFISLIINFGVESEFYYYFDFSCYYYYLIITGIVIDS